MLDAMPEFFSISHPAPGGHIRDLAPRELPEFRDHLLRLAPGSRRDRFNGYTDDAFIEAYATRCFESGARVVGYFLDGRVGGAAELHCLGSGEPKAAEIAFSVDDDLQHRGIGARLFDRLIMEARELGYRDLHVTTHPQNRAMKALARKFGANLCFRTHEAVGVIDLDRVGETPPLPAELPSLEDRVRPNPLVALAGIAGTFAGVGRAAFGFYAPGLVRK